MYLIFKLNRGTLLTLLSKNINFVATKAPEIHLQNIYAICIKGTCDQHTIKNNSVKKSDNKFTQVGKHLK